MPALVSSSSLEEDNVSHPRIALLRDVKKLTNSKNCSFYKMNFKSKLLLERGTLSLRLERFNVHQLHLHDASSVCHQDFHLLQAGYQFVTVTTQLRSLKHY
ncbi:hypothetical protein TNCV_4809391 [Trichonephila clavipes]|nr:hypothetical protein TNCV_4809391 [Trichonephila clavipes]